MSWYPFDCEFQTLARLEHIRSWLESLTSLGSAT